MGATTTYVAIYITAVGDILTRTKMSIHTSQCLLSALLDQLWSLASYPIPCCVEIPRGLSRDEIQSIQDEANDDTQEVKRKLMTNPRLESSRRLTTIRVM